MKLKTFAEFSDERSSKPYSQKLTMPKTSTKLAGPIGVPDETPMKKWKKVLNIAWKTGEKIHNKQSL